MELENTRLGLAINCRNVISFEHIETDTRAFHSQQRSLLQDNLTRHNLPRGEQSSPLPGHLPDYEGGAEGLMVPPVLRLAVLVTVGHFTTNTGLQRFN